MSDYKIKKASRQDVADYAGVSTTTVSYVLNKTKRVTKVVEKRVNDAVIKLNYTPNRVAQSLAGKKTHTVALLTNDMSNQYQIEVFKGLQNEALKNDYVVFLFDMSGDTDKYIMHLVSRNFDGVYVTVAPNDLSDSKLDMMSKSGLAVLTDYARGTYLNNVSYVASDMQGGLMSIVKMLKEKGHKNIAYASAFDENCYYDKRLFAFKNAMKEVFDQNDCCVECGTFPYNTSKRLGAELASKIIAKHKETTAIIFTNDNMAIGGIDELKRQGINIPNDISVVGIDNIAMAQTSSPPLTTLSQEGRRYGAMVFNIMLNAINNKQSTKRLLPMEIIMRESVKQIN